MVPNCKKSIMKQGGKKINDVLKSQNQTGKFLKLVMVCLALALSHLGHYSWEVNPQRNIQQTPVRWWWWWWWLMFYGHFLHMVSRATSKGNEAKSKMKHPSDMPTLRFVVQHATTRPRRRPDKHWQESDLNSYPGGLQHNTLTTTLVSNLKCSTLHHYDQATTHHNDLCISGFVYTFCFDVNKDHFEN